MLHALAWKHFKEAPSCTDFPEKVFPHNAALVIPEHRTECGSFCLVLLFSRSLLSTPIYTLFLPTCSTTSSHECWFSSPSPVVPSLNLSLPAWPACWQRYFHPTFSDESYILLASLDSQRGSHDCKSWIPVGTSRIASCWPTGSVQSFSSSSPSLAILRSKHMGPPCHWPSLPNPHRHCWYAPDLSWQ